MLGKAEWSHPRSLNRMGRQRLSAMSSVFDLLACFNEHSGSVQGHV